MSWWAKIEKKDNGYLVKYEGYDRAEGVYSEKDDSYEFNKDHIIKMLYDVLRFFEESGSEYDKLRIKICYEIGHKLNLSEKEIKELKESVGFGIIK